MEHVEYLRHHCRLILEQNEYQYQYVETVFEQLDCNSWRWHWCYHKVMSTTPFVKCADHEGCLTSI